MREGQQSKILSKSRRLGKHLVSIRARHWYTPAEELFISMLKVTSSSKTAVIVPAKDAGKHISGCLAAIFSSVPPIREIIVVDDGSTDETPSLAEKAGAQVHRMHQTSGPGAARNRGAALTRADVIVFVDSDVVVRSDTIATLVEAIQSDLDVAAAFGSYDEWPPCINVVSRYANLRHHFVHQSADNYASTFWAGCGAIRRATFVALGGFDEKFRFPSIEDIELGSRIVATKARIAVVKSAQATHLKCWTLLGLWKTDISRRAIPWSKLIANSRRMPNELNARTSERISALAAHGAWFSFLLALWVPSFALLSLVMAMIWVSLQHKILRFFFRKLPFLQALLCSVLHWLYFIYSSAIFLIVYTVVSLRRLVFRA